MTVRDKFDDLLPSLVRERSPYYIDGNSTELSSQIMKKQTFTASEIIYQAGAPSDRVYVIKAGKVALIDTYPETGTEVSAVLGIGKVFGEMELLNGGVRTSTAQAMEDVKVVSFTYEEMMDLLFNNPEKSLILNRTAFNQLRELFGGETLDAQMYRLRREMDVAIKQAVINHEARVVKSHNGMMAMALPIILLVIVVAAIQFFLPNPAVLLSLI
uniref:Cyclic nucleotide-binding protein n=1 Tax=Cyanothece sp. (strain PCC 7425 / ATCC 29141) TaxID=395961 RepID=B8HLS2_CYAP4